MMKPLKVLGDKELYNMALTELWELFLIALKEYNSDYTKWYEAEKNNLSQILAMDDTAKTIDLNKGYTKSGFADKVFHFHVRRKDNHGELYFRDYLCRHDTVAKDYERLKNELKAQYKHDRDGYTNAETDFIQRYTALARQEFGELYDPANSDNQRYRPLNFRGCEKGWGL
jgi:hypothetical protein